MRPADDEDRLRNALAEAHRGDPQPPSFQRLWSPAGHRPRRGHPLLLAAGLAGVAIAAALWLTRPAKPPPWHPTGTRWVAPTDFLLDTPGLLTLRTLPTLNPEGLP